jgi:omega-amidase
MNITIIQTSLHWENKTENLKHFEQLMAAVSPNTSLIILPEMFTTGFTMRPEVNAEDCDGEGLQWMQRMAQIKNAVICGSMAVKDQDNFFNRLYWVKPDSSYHQYDKRHLFRMAKEDKHYTAGKTKIIPVIGNWKICPLVCYDLRFPVWSRNRYNHGAWEYDVLIYVANWPEVRSYPWKQLLIARAIENQCYVIGVNRIGVDGNGITHSGDSMVINPRGEVISQTNTDEESVETITLSREYLDEFRKVFPAGLDADDFTLNI